MLRHLTVTLMLILSAGLMLPISAQDSGNRDKNFDVRSSIGDMHVGSDVDAKKIGLPLYPGARLKTEDKDSTPANLSFLTEAFGMHVVVAQYASDDAPAKILDFYRDKLKKYGKVLECHSQNHGGDISVHEDDKDSEKDSKDKDKDTKKLKCDENSGPVTELKVGTEENQHVVAVESGDASTGSKFALVYLHTRGKRGDI